MRSTKNRRAVIVGIVIAIGLIIFLTGIFTLGGQHNTFSKSVSLKAVFKDINGLQKGNNIWFAGVKVGTVKSIDFNERSEVEVTLNLAKDMQHLIHKDAFAKVGSDGLIGNRIIVIYGGSLQSPVVDNGDRLGVESVASTQGMIDTLQMNNRNLLAITDNLKTLSGSIVNGEGSVGKLLTTDELYTQLNGAVTLLNATASNARAMSGSLNSYAAKLQTKGTFANDLVTDTAVFRRLRETSTQLEQAAGRANNVTSNLETVSANLNNPDNSALGVLLNDTLAAVQLSNTITNLQTGSVLLNEDLEAAQHNFLLRGFFKKKKKAEAKEAGK